jgi:hypothetical protein
MPASPALPGLFFCFAATVLLIFATVSSPVWNKISFLNVGPGGTLRYGVFGYTGSPVSVGYYFSGSTTNTTAIHNLTKILILHPIAAGLSGLAVLFGIYGAAYHRTGTVFMTVLASLATVVTLFVFVIDLALFGIVRRRFRNEGVPAQYGNATWITLGALVALLMASCTSAVGICGRYRGRNRPTHY